MERSSGAAVGFRHPLLRNTPTSPRTKEPNNQRTKNHEPRTNHQPHGTINPERRFSRHLMRIPVAWLREYVAVPEDEAGLEAFCDALTMAGLEVEEILESPVGPTLFTKITPNRGDWASVY